MSCPTASLWISADTNPPTPPGRPPSLSSLSPGRASCRSHTTTGVPSQATGAHHMPRGHLTCLGAPVTLPRALSLPLSLSLPRAEYRIPKMTNHPVWERTPCFLSHQARGRGTPRPESPSQAPVAGTWGHMASFRAELDLGKEGSVDGTVPHRDHGEGAGRTGHTATAGLVGEQRAEVGQNPGVHSRHSRPRDGLRQSKLHTLALGGDGN